MKTRYFVGTLNIEGVVTALREGYRIRVTTYRVGVGRWRVHTRWPGGMGSVDRVWSERRADRQAARRVRELRPFATFVRKYR